MYIYSYSREQAIQDGVLIDITDLAKEAGFKWPVAITDTLYHQYIESDQVGQSIEGRIWDVLTILRQKAGHNGSIIYFTVFFLNDEGKKEEVQLKAIGGPGDEGEPVITIMFPFED